MRNMKATFTRVTILFIICSFFPQIGFSTVEKQRQKSISHLVKQDCGSCHGMTLKGGLGPSLKQNRLKDRSNEYLFTVIKNGLPNTPMPPWNPFLTDDEIHWLIEQLRKDSF